MAMWHGAAGICVNENGQLLMILQGKPEEEKSWSVPSGGLEEGETLEQCCAREVLEETGYEIRIIRQLHEKKGSYPTINVDFCVTYFEVEVIGGLPVIQDPDNLIHEIAWKSAEELELLELSFEEDRPVLQEWIRGRG